MTQAPKGVAGVILKLELTNFMCHASLALDFNPAVNFIVGKNGSGKSAIMTALMVVLGTKASDTSRGKSLHNFIKTGSNQARIKITLKNSGANSFKPNRYGDKIILVRTLSKSGGKFTIHTINDGFIHLPRTELDNILEAFSIKLPNPFALLTQETMKTFLNNSKPNHMYDLVKEGTGIRDAQRKITDLGEQLAWMQMKEKKLNKDVEYVRTELKKWTEKRKISAKVTNTKEKIISLQHEVLWAKVITEEGRLTAFQNQLQKFITSRLDKEKGLEAFQRKVDKVKGAIGENDDKLSDWRLQLRMKGNERDAIKAEYEAKMNEASKLHKEYLAQGNKMQALVADKETLESGLRKYAKQSSPEEVQRRAQRRQEVEQLEAELADIKATKATLSTEVHRLMEENTAKTIAIREKKSHISVLKDRYRRQRIDLEAAKRQAGTLPPVYGPKMVTFLKEIDKAFSKGQFSKKPIGPIGMQIKVRDHSWSLAIEGYLRSECANFFCNTNEDRVTLTKICQRVMPHHRLTVVASKFMEQPFDVRRNKAVASGNLVNLMDMLEIMDPVVMNYLIDQKQVETILLCPTTQEAMQIMCHQSSVPHGCRQMITKEAEQVYPAPNYRFYSSEIKNVQYLVKSKEASVQNEEAQIAEGEAEIAQLEKELLQEERSCKQSSAEYQKANAHTRQLNSREFDLQRQVEASREEETDNNQDYVNTVNNEIAEITGQMAECAAQKQELKHRAEEAKKKRTEREAALKNLVTDFDIVKDQLSELEEKKMELEEQLYTVQEKAKREKEKHAKEHNQEEKLAENVEEHGKKVRTLEEIASKESPRINTRRSVEAVEREIEELKVFMNSINTNLEDPKLIKEQITKFEDEVQKLNVNIAEMDQHCRDSAATYKQRKQSYANAMTLTFVHISEVFRLLIKKQHFEGDVNFDHKTKQMNINLKMKGKNKEEAKNLSGGERSYTTIALILSVWDKLRIPFYMLDEFDVFMDMMNRRICSDMLIAEALQKKGRQFMFFTPQEMNLDAADNITIHKLADPRVN